MTFPDALKALVEDPAAPLDVAETALLFASDEYPDLDLDLYLRRIEELAMQAVPAISGDLESRVAGLASFLFEECGFQGNSSDYYDPRNSYLNDVLDRRLGIPISLTVLAIAVGERVGLEVVGVGLPGHFIAKAIDGDDEVFFDPFHGGQLLTPAACSALVEAVTGRPFQLTAEALQPLPLVVMLARMLNNLKGIYSQLADYRRSIRVMERLHILSAGDPMLRRDLGVALMQDGRAGPAVDHLSAYLARFPEAADAKLVKDLLLRAKKELARWN